MKQKKSAFSLIEISIIILALSFLTVIIYQGGKSLLRKSALVAAKSLTKSSPVNSTKGLLAWYETTLSESFDKEYFDGQAITKWKDINPSASTPFDLQIYVDANAGNTETGPVLTEYGINDLPALTFSDATRTTLYTGTIFPLYEKQIGVTIFVVIKDSDIATSQIALTSGNWDGVCGKNIYVSINSGTNGNFGLTNNCGHGHLTSGAILANDEVAILSSIIPETASFPVVPLLYKNGTLQTSSSIGSFLNAGNTQSHSPLFVGSYGSTFGAAQNSAAGFIKGKIGEIIIFKRALPASERKAIEFYLGKKWNIKVT